MPCFFPSSAKPVHIGLGALLLTGLLHGCTPVTSHQTPNSTAKLSMCEVIDTLIEGHATGFESLRGTHNDTPYGDIWKARYDVVGSGCEIWRSGHGNTHYVCTRSAPDKATADIYYRDALNTVRGCLGAEWKDIETPRKLGVGVKTTFKEPAKKAAVIVHEIQTNGLFKEQWTIYYVVGEPNSSI